MIDTPERPLPNDLDAERAVLSCMLRWPERIIPQATARLTEKHFYSPANQILFRHVLILFNRGNVDLALLNSSLRERGELDKVGGPRAAAEIQDDVAIPEMYSEYAAKLVKCFRYRAMYPVFNRAVRDLYDAEKAPEEIADKVVKATADIVEEVATVADTSWTETITVFYEHLDRATESGGGISGISTGFAKLDDMTNGFVPGELWYEAGLSGAGKTALMLNQATAVVKSGIPIGCVSMEMSRAKLASRVFSSETRINSKHINRGILEEKDLQTINEGVNSSKDWPFFIDDRSNLRIVDIEIQTRKWVRENNIKVLFVDYLSLMDVGDERRRDRDDLEVAERSKALLRIARQHNITVVCLAQFSREVKKKGKGNKPRKEDIRGSSAIENDAHVVALLHQTDPESQDDNVQVELIIDKCREGEQGVVELEFHRPTQTFMEV